MKKVLTVVISMFALTWTLQAASAQQRGGRGGENEWRERSNPWMNNQGRRGPGGPGQTSQPRPAPPLLAALDADSDGVLSAEEIGNAAKALKSLDKDGDGAISREEMRPPRPEALNQGGRNRGAGQSWGRNSGPNWGRDQGREQPGAREGNMGGEFISRIMKNDANEDGKLSKDELPQRMQRMLEHADTNKDAALDKTELEAMAKKFVERMRQGGNRRGGPGGNDGPGAGEKPQRPDFE